MSTSKGHVCSGGRSPKVVSQTGEVGHLWGICSTNTSMEREMRLTGWVRVSLEQGSAVRGVRILLTHLCDLLPTSLEWALKCDLSSDQLGVSQAQEKRDADHGIRGRMKGTTPR